MTDPVGELRAKVRKVVLLIFLTSFVAGAAYQLIVPLVYILAIFILIRLAAVAISYWFHR
jgi:hypothetical protein